MANIPRTLSLAVFRVHIENGLSVALGVGLSGVIAGSVFGFDAAIAAASGALCVSISDQPEPLSQKPWVLGFALLSAFFFTALSSIARFWEPAFIAAVAFTGLWTGLISVYGKRAQMMGVTGVVIMIMLFLAYRSISTVLLVLVMVGFEMGTARGLVAMLGNYDLLGFSTFVVAMLSSLAIAAGTDYAIFLIGRYQEARQAGQDREAAYYSMFRGTFHIILGSGLTIAGATFCLHLARLSYFKALGIPPAWEDVWISPDPDGHLLATGIDARGRKQYRYHPDFRRRRDERKYDRILEFGAALPRLRRRIDADLRRHGLPREKVVAAVVALLDATSLRVRALRLRKANVAGDDA